MLAKCPRAFMEVGGSMNQDPSALNGTVLHVGGYLKEGRTKGHPELEMHPPQPPKTRDKAT